MGEPHIGPISGVVADGRYKLCVGNGVNAMCLELTQDQYSDSEEKWRAEHSSSPPYLMILLGPTKKHESIISHAKEEGRTISTFESFLAARAEVRNIDDKVLPPLLSALTCSFSSDDPPVHFRPIEHVDFGLTTDGRTIRDFTLRGNANLSISRRLESPQIEERLACGVNIASTINPKVARFFQLALNDEDPLKKFLYFFLAIEIQTHATFKKIDHTKNFSLLVAAPDRVALSARSFFVGQPQRWTNLRDRFVWCVLCAWTHVTDADVDEFLRLKSVRDEIAHGSIAEPPHSAVKAAQRLAAKLQLS
jgi:hypothetical protein